MLHIIILSYIKPKYPKTVFIVINSPYLSTPESLYPAILLAISFVSSFLVLSSSSTFAALPFAPGIRPPLFFTATFPGIRSEIVQINTFSFFPDVDYCVPVSVDGESTFFTNICTLIKADFLNLSAMTACFSRSKPSVKKYSSFMFDKCHHGIHRSLPLHLFLTPRPQEKLPEGRS